MSYTEPNLEQVVWTGEICVNINACLRIYRDTKKHSELRFFSFFSPLEF